MNYKELKELILERRSIRKFKDEPVSRDVLEELIDCARWAPSDTNSQPWRFIATSNKEKIKMIENATLEGIRLLQLRAEDQGMTAEARKLDVFGKYALVFKDAPTVIIGLSEDYKSKFTENVFKPIGYGQELWREEGIKSASLACQNILLAAHAMGYGTCPMSAPMILAEEKIKKELGIEDKYTLTLLIAIGKPDGKPAAPPRKGVSEILEIIE